MATIEELFSDPALLNRTGVALKLRGKQKQTLQRGLLPESDRTAFQREQAKSILGAVGPGQEARIGPGEVGVKKTLGFTRERLKSAAEAPLIEGGVSRTGGARLGEFTRTPETGVQEAISRAQIGEAGLSSEVRKLAQESEEVRRGALDQVLGQSGSLGGDLNERDLSEALRFAGFDPSFQQNLQKILTGTAIGKLHDKTSFLKALAINTLGFSTGGLLGAAGTTFGNIKAEEEKKKAFEQLLRSNVGAGVAGSDPFDAVFDEATNALPVGRGNEDFSDILFPIPGEERYRGLRPLGGPRQ